MYTTYRENLLKDICKSNLDEMRDYRFVTPEIIDRVSKNYEIIISDYNEGYITFAEALKDIITEW